jgi:glycosyltransferase involved in cell wall biosynthesis
MKILVISYCYPPSLNPRAFRWAALAEHWAREGHHVDVVCESAPSYAESETVNGVHVYRAGNSLLGKLRGETGTHANARHVSGAGKLKSALTGLIKKAGRYVWRRIYWPDYACLWYKHALRKATALQAENDYDVMYSSSIPFTGHLVALGIKHEYPALKWVADIGDPFCFSDGVTVNNFAIYEGLNIRYEKKVFSLADAISVTTGATGERYSEIFPMASSKISVIPPLLSVEPATEKIASQTFLKDSKIRLVFLGTLYKTIRDPVNLLKIFTKLLESDIAERLELHFYGDISSCRDCFHPYDDLIGKKIFIHGLVDRKSAAAAMRDADILVNIGNDTAYQLPSKVVEYLFMMKPILNLAKSREDSSTGFFRQYDGIFCVVGNEAMTDRDVFDGLERFVMHPLRIDTTSRFQLLPSFQIAEIAAKYLSLASRK